MITVSSKPKWGIVVQFLKFTLYTFPISAFRSFIGVLEEEGFGKRKSLAVMLVSTGIFFPHDTVDWFRIYFDVDKRVANIAAYVAQKVYSPLTLSSAETKIQPLIEVVIEESASTVWVNPDALTEIEVGDAIIQSGCGHHYEFLLKRAQCESSWITSACDYIDGRHCGLVQIGEQHPKRLGYRLNDRFDRVKVFEMACALLDEPGGGEYPWTASNECWVLGPNLDGDDVRDGWEHLKTLENKTYLASN